MAPIKFEENIKDKLEKRTLSPASDSWSKLAERLDPVNQWAVNDEEDYMVVRWSEVLGEGQLAQDWLVTPQVAITATTNLLTFDMTDFNEPDYGSEVTVRVSTDASQTNIAPFTTVLTIDELETNGGAFLAWEVDLSAYIGSSVYVAFVMENNDGDAWGLDNVDFTEVPSCVPPTEFIAEAATTSSFEISWSDSNTGTPTWDIEWGAADFTLGSGTMVNGLTETTYNFSGLTASTAYEFYIRTNCGTADGTSDWIGPVAFTSNTDCATYGIPYDETFDNDGAFTTCYTTEDVDGNTLSWITQQNLDLDADGTVETFATNASGTADFTNKDDWFFSPALELTGGTEYEFSSAYNVLQGNGIASLEAFIMDGPSSTANVVATLFSNENFTTQGEFATLEAMAYQESNTFTPSTTGDYYIAYRSFGPQGGGFLLLFNSSLNTTLSIDGFEQATFSHFYNKDSEVLNLESATSTFTNVELYSITGKKILSSKLSNSTENIDVSNFSTGVYLAKVNMNGQIKTIKFVKN